MSQGTVPVTGALGEGADAGCAVWARGKRFVAAGPLRNCSGASVA